MTKIGWKEQTFLAELDGQMYECDVCGFDCRKRDTRIEYGWRVCPDCQDKSPMYPRSKQPKVAEGDVSSNV